MQQSAGQCSLGICALLLLAAEQKAWSSPLQQAHMQQVPSRCRPRHLWGAILETWCHFSDDCRCCMHILPELIAGHIFAGPRLQRAQCAYQCLAP